MSQQELSVQMFEVKTDQAFKHGFNVTARTIQLIGEVTDEMFAELDTAMTILEEEARAGITIKINSTGGSCYDALAIVGRIRSSKCKITTEGFGAMMSAASLILASGNKRRMSKYGWCMHHEIWTEGIGGTVSQISHAAKQFEREFEMWSEMMGKFTTSPKQFWQSQGRNGKDLYLTAEECLTLGVIDEVF
ncbi:MAG: ClpP family protease [Candidatus Paceibacterota bacterium]